MSRRRPVDAVEPVARVVGVAVERLRAQQVGARVPEARALAERDRRERERVHAHAVVHRGRARELERERVEQRLVVVRVDVGDRSSGRAGVAAGMDLAGLCGPLTRRSARSRARWRSPGGAGRASCGPPPRTASRRRSLNVPIPVPAMLRLRGGDEQRVVGDLAEAPALAVEVQVRQALARALSRFAFVWWPMRSKRKPSTRYSRAQVLERVEHQLLHHPVLARGVRAARRGLERAGLREPVVVAGDDPVEDRARMLAGGGRVVVDDVQDDAQADRVERAHHLPELLRAVRRIARVGALGRRVVQRVVAPVEAVAVAHLARRAAAAPRSRAARCSSGPGSSCRERSSSIVAMSLHGSRCTVVRPASASARRWRMPSLSACVNAR